MKLTKNADIDRHKYSGCGIGNNAIIFGVDMSSTVHANNFCTYYLQKRSRKKFCLSLHYKGVNSYLFVNGTGIIKFKAKDSEIVANPLCLESFRKIFF